MVEQYNQNFINQDGDAIFLTPTEQTVTLTGGGGRIYYVDTSSVPDQQQPLLILLPFSSVAGINAEITIAKLSDSEVGPNIVVRTQDNTTGVPKPDDPLKSSSLSGGSPGLYDIATTNGNVTISADSKKSWFVTAFVN